MPDAVTNAKEDKIEQLRKRLGKLPPARSRPGAR